MNRVSKMRSKAMRCSFFLVVVALVVEFPKPPQVLAADLPSSQVYEPGIDPTMGASLAAYGPMTDSTFILEAFQNAIDEMVSVGLTEVSIAATRNVDPATGDLLDEGDIATRPTEVVGPNLATIQAAVAYASQSGLHVTIQPMFELTDGVDENGDVVGDEGSFWRANFTPEMGTVRDTFAAEYTAFIAALAGSPGLDRIDFGSELNGLVREEYERVDEGTITVDDHILVQALAAVEQSCFSGETSYVATLEDYREPGTLFLWNLQDGSGQRRVDYLGINTYYIDWRTTEQFENGVELFPATSILYRDEESLVAGTGEVPADVVNLMEARWDIALDEITTYAESVGLPVFIQEVGLVRRDLSSVATTLLEPTIPSSNVTTEAIDSAEMKAYYQAYLRAMDGRGDVIKAAHAWTWDHSEDLASRDLDLPICVGAGDPLLYLPTGIGCQLGWYEIWPDDNGGGEALVNFIQTADDCPKPKKKKKKKKKNKKK